MATHEAILSRERWQELLVAPPSFVAALLYAALALVLFGGPLFDPDAHRCVCISSTTDAGVYVWGFEWWPHALIHGLNPFFTRMLFAPQGIDLAHSTMAPGAALILAPVTALAGPLFSFNLAMLLSTILGAFFAFLLARRITGAFLPSLVAGWLYGFSSYVLGQLVGHLNLTLVFLLPAIVHLVLRAFAGELGRRRFAVLLTLALVLQFSFSIEVFASLTLFGLIAAGFAWVLGTSEVRARFRPLAIPVLASYVATALLLSPYLYWLLKPGGYAALPGRSDLFSNDLLAFVVPSQITRLGGLTFLSTSSKFTAQYVEGGAYLGIPLIVLAALGARMGWRSPGVRVMLATAAVVLVCTLGGHLHVDGSRSIPLPWWFAERLPVLGQMLPARFAVYLALIAALLAATALNRAPWPVVMWALALVAIASLWPATNRSYWDGSPELPRFFTTSAYKRALTPRDTVLVLPVAIAGQSMLWDAETHLGFQMAGGYVGGPTNPYKRFSIYPTLTYDARIPNMTAAMRTFLADEHITAVVLDARTAGMSVWLPLLEQLGWVPTTLDGVVVLRRGAPPPL